MADEIILLYWLFSVPLFAVAAFLVIWFVAPLLAVMAYLLASIITKNGIISFRKEDE